MSEDIKSLWVEENRPKTLDEYVVSEDIREKLSAMIKSKQLTNMTLLGTQGIGKTTLAKVIANEMNAVTLFVPCGVNGTLDYLRTTITDFCKSMTLDGRLKIVILDEIDSASSSGDNNFQKALRNLIESSSSDTRWILTGNFAEKIIAPLRLSRCPVINLKFTPKDLLVRVRKILDLHNVKYTKESLKEFVTVGIKKLYPDIRAIVNFLQVSSASGELKVNENIISDSASKDTLKEVVEHIKNDKNVLDVRKFYIQSKNKINDPVVFASDLFNYVLDNELVDDTELILRMTDKIYQLNQVIDKETGLFGLICLLHGNIKDK